MKAIVLNASPRKDWNTAQMLKSAMSGAQSTGAEVEYINLYDLNFTGGSGKGVRAWGKVKPVK